MSDLRQKLREKRNVLNMARRPGANAQVNQAFARLGPSGLSTENQKEMLQEVKDNMKGLRKKDAKKKFRQVSELLSDDQSQTFDRLVSQSFPEQRDQIKAMATQGRKAKQTREQKRQEKMQAVPNYVPQSVRTEEVRTRRGRSFQRVDIAIPKLQELPKWSAPPPPPALPSSGMDLPPPPSQKRSPEAIRQLFQPPPPSCPVESRPLTWDQRLALLKQFSSNHFGSLTKEWQQWMLSHGQSEDLKRIGEVRVLPMACLALPFSETATTTEQFALYQGLSDRERKLSPFVSRLDATQQVCWQGKNGYHQYQHFLLHFLPVIVWMRSLKGQNIPWPWLVQRLKPLGVLVQPTASKNQVDFQLMEHVYHDKDQHVTPLLPFVSVLWQS